MSDFNLPAELLSPEMVFKSLNESFAARGLQAQQSPQGRGVTTLPLDLNDRDTPLAANVSVPLWLEIKTANSPYATWAYVPWVKQPVVEESRARGELRCSFYRDAQTAFWHLMLSYDPMQVAHQLWHAGDVQLISSDKDALPFEASFSIMFKHEAVINLIPKIIQRGANLPEERQLNSGQISALNMLLAHAQSEIKDKWIDLWQNRNRASKEQRGRARRKIIGRGSPLFGVRTY